MPTRFNVTSRVVVPITLNPLPPCATGNERYGGSHVNKPHHANIPKKFMSRSVKVLPMYSGSKRVEKPILSAEVVVISVVCAFAAVDFWSRFFHISLSGTFRWIQNVM